MHVLSKYIYIKNRAVSIFFVFCDEMNTMLLLTPARAHSRKTSADYWKNNFNSMASAVVVLFEQMVINNWTVVLEGCIAVRPPSDPVL